MFEQAFKNIDADLRNEAGCTTELDYTEQTSWLLFLKYLDGLEQDKAMEAELEGKKYAFILDEPYRWSSWAAPKDKDGKLDHNKAQTGDDLRDFVDRKLFPYLHGFKQKATGPNTIEYKIGEIFGEIKNKIQSGYTLREIIDHIDELRFRSQAEKHELSHLYEAKIKNMGNAGRNGGEYYTPRPLIRAMVQVIQPKVGERIYDGACGSAGFLCESFDYLRQQPKLTADNLKTLQERTFYGKEKKPLAYVIAIMNMILHGIEAPNIIHTNTLAENLADIQDKDRMDVILANPPFGGGERKEVQQNFPIRTGETAFLFLQHFIKILKAGGRAAVVIKNTFLTNTDNASVSLRKLLLETCNLHTVLDCPGGTFQGAGVKTIVMFFEKGSPTRKIWFYQIDPRRNLGKTNPLNDNDLAKFVALQPTKPNTEQSWTVDVADLDSSTYDLSIKNPDESNELIPRVPIEIIDEISQLDTESADVLGNIRASQFEIERTGQGWVKSSLGDVLEVIRNGLNCKQDKSGNGSKISRIESIWNGEFDISRVGYAEIPEHQREKFLLKKGDLLFSHINSAIHVGKTALFDVEEEVVHGVNLLLMRPKSFVSPAFLNLYLKHIFSAGYWLRVCKQSINQASVNQQDISRVPFRYPDMGRQLAIVEKMNALTDETQKLTSLYERKATMLAELKKSLLGQAFDE